MSCYGMTEAEWRAIPELERGAVERAHYEQWVKEHPGIQATFGHGEVVNAHGPGLEVSVELQ